MNEPEILYDSFVSSFVLKIDEGFRVSCNYFVKKKPEILYDSFVSSFVLKIDEGFRVSCNYFVKKKPEILFYEAIMEDGTENDVVLEKKQRSMYSVEKEGYGVSTSSDTSYYAAPICHEKKLVSKMIR
ncbi:hypothetical protein Tco_1543207, partial [Tanacetum coccineum]